MFGRVLLRHALDTGRVQLHLLLPPGLDVPDPVRPWFGVHDPLDPDAMQLGQLVSGGDCGGGSVSAGIVLQLAVEQGGVRGAQLL